MSDKPAAVRRLVTMLFTDICGYTALSEAVDPEDVEELLEGFRALASDVIQAHGGIINQFMGDSFLALFGLPAAHDDDAQRAVNSALAMHAEFAERIRPYEQRWGRQLALHRT
jgi:class 3 adenylate cyclase